MYSNFFTNIAAIQNMRVLYHVWLYESYGAYYWYIKILQCGYMGHGLKDIALYIQKHIEHRAVSHNFLPVRDQPLGAPAFAKLVYCSLMTITLNSNSIPDHHVALMYHYAILSALPFGNVANLQVTYQCLLCKSLCGECVSWISKQFFIRDV